MLLPPTLTILKPTGLHNSKPELKNLLFLRKIHQMNALGGYAQTEVAGMPEAELESRALIKTAAALNRIKENWDSAQGDLHTALDKNRHLWSILAAAMREDDCPQPVEIKKNIINLASFIFKRTMDIMAVPTPEKLNILISINMNIAQGLSGKAPNEEVLSD